VAGLCWPPHSSPRKLSQTGKLVNSIRRNAPSGRKNGESKELTGTQHGGPVLTLAIGSAITVG
jgi:hypothetical protein